MNEKRCAGCDTPKPLTDFGPDKRRGDGRKARCRPCLAETRRAAIAIDPDAHRARQRSPEARAARNAYLRARRERDPSWRRAQNARAQQRYDRRAREGATRREVGDRDGWTCYLCGLEVERSDAHVDHIVAVARGGTSILENLAITHKDCNRRKRDLPIAGLAWVIPSAIQREAIALRALREGIPLPARRDRQVTRLGWTVEEDERLRLLWRDAPWPDLLREINRSAEGIRHRARTLDLPRTYRRRLAGLER